MILLRDVSEIEAPPERVFDWLVHLQENYIAWHPDHVECRYLRGTSLLELGSVLYIEEYLHGELHKLKFRTTKVIPNSRLEYKAGFGIGGAFEVRPQEDKALFIAEMTMGSSLPLVEPLLDRLLEKLLSDNLEAMKQHMAEEGENLKRLLEQDASLSASEEAVPDHAGS
jgi:uncharacterized protein YndB with AHSA1/START domain